MNSFDYYRSLIQGERTGLAAIFAKSCLSCAAAPYSVAVRIRNRLFDRGWKKSVRLPVPVLSVGNLTLGGTGKTPCVVWLARYLKQYSASVGLISRGYKTTEPLPNDDLPFPEYRRQNDEARELSILLPQVPHFQSPNRYLAGSALMKAHPDIDVVLLDDAFQHRRLTRDLDIVLLDALDPFGSRHVFPRGFLREPISGLRRADIVILSRANLVSPEQIDRVREEVRRISPNAIFAAVAHKPRYVRTWSDPPVPYADWKARLSSDQTWLAACGIGNPSGFYRMLQQEKIPFSKTRSFPDHYHYRHADCLELARLARENHNDGILVTMKDLVKFQRNDLDGIPLAALEIGLEFLEGQETVCRRLDQFFTHP